MIEKTVVITNRLGIHARPATVFVQAASKHDADIFLSKGDVSRVNGKSIMGVMMLAAEQGAEVL
ncbi:MAG: HPr family phosphocarrier protein, partial [Gemmatimonadetes bacterium]|nr:HPr family phosphocarrier protein [Gemmatimonadota bacterium]